MSIKELMESLSKDEQETTKPATSCLCLDVLLIYLIYLLTLHIK